MAEGCAERAIRVRTRRPAADVGLARKRKASEDVRKLEATVSYQCLDGMLEQIEIKREIFISLGFRYKKRSH